MKNIVLLITVLVGIISCNSNNNDNISQKEIEKVLKDANYNPIILERSGIKLVEFTDFPKFHDVTTKIASKNQTFKLGINKIEFNNHYFNLGENTSEENVYGCRLNESGQYLGVIKPNGSIKKVINTQFETDVNQGDNFYLCYLSRSYDLSIKNPNASFLFKIKADKNGCFSETYLSDTVIALLQPRGSFTINNRNRILLDFYLKNVEIGDGYISLIIDNVEFKLRKWVPFWISGLDLGRHKVSIELKNKGGESIKGIMPKQQISTFKINEIDFFTE
jgi:hypothetical protein